MRKLLLVGLMMLGLAVLPAPPAQAAPEKAEIVRILGEIHTLPGMRDSLERNGFTGENLELAVRQIGIMLGDRQIANHIAERILAAGRGDFVNAQAAQGLIQPLLSRGMGHLSERELGYFYQVETTVLKAMTKRDCGLSFRNRLPPDELARRTAKVAARLNAPALKEYYRIQYKAAKLGVTRGPKVLSDALRERVATRLNVALNEAAEATPEGRAAMKAFARLESVGNPAACDAGLFFMDVVMNMDAAARHETFLVLSEQ
ncbi:hypothetical protein [Lentibacter sp. XHP0401]|uniref:hypothetical protein n=1 Tax=Lentibacter sp. XHP0401 TaxID=2984334 RepID=UPI0021E8B916|nr:hypothetical protein [Lentibacter sp. XHP0401]MCV2893839.1 hypothetical protein [Lentibacter sp. XHP0401]